MRYRRETAFSGDSRKALELVQATLVQAGYRITDASPTAVAGEHVGGFFWNASGQAIYAASPISIRIQSGRLLLEAGYDGVARIRTFLVRLLLGLAAFLGLTLGLTFSLVFQSAWPAALGAGLGVGVPLIQLPIHLGVTLPLIRARATRTLDTLVDNLLTVC